MLGGVVEGGSYLGGLGKCLKGDRGAQGGGPGGSQAWQPLPLKAHQVLPLPGGEAGVAPTTGGGETLV